VVEEAQQRIVEIVRRLEEEQQIVIVRGGAEGGEVFVLRSVKKNSGSTPPFPLPSVVHPLRRMVRCRNSGSDDDGRLDFARTVSSREIALWRDRFDRHIDAHGTVYERGVGRAYGNGYEKGTKRGSLHERSERIIAIETLLREASGQKEQAIRDLETRVIELAVGIAERIIGRSIAANRKSSPISSGKRCPYHRRGNGRPEGVRGGPRIRQFAVTSNGSGCPGTRANSASSRIAASGGATASSKPRSGLVDAVLLQPVSTYLIEELLKHGVEGRNPCIEMSRRRIDSAFFLMYPYPDVLQVNRSSDLTEAVVR